MVVLSAALALTCALDVVLATTCDEGGIVTVTEDILLTVNDITKKVVDQDLAKISKGKPPVRCPSSFPSF